jgi:hypothetical protein
MAYVLKDTQNELVFYEKIANSYMNVGNTYMMQKYHNRAFYGLIEPLDGVSRRLAQ